MASTVISLAAGHRQFRNAVVVPVVEAVARYIQPHILSSIGSESRATTPRHRIVAGQSVMPLADLADWMDEYDRPDFVWYVKRLSANDTLATRSHQAGPYGLRSMLDFQHKPSN